MAGGDGGAGDDADAEGDEEGALANGNPMADDEARQEGGKMKAAPRRKAGVTAKHGATRKRHVARRTVEDSDDDSVRRSPKTLSP